MDEAKRDALLAANAERWLAALRVRRSRRSYDGRPVAAADLEALEELAGRFRPWPGARVAVICEAPAALFMGIVGSYGGVSGAPSALAFIGRHECGPETVGYTGEALVLEATARGLGTCWVGGLFEAAPVRRLVEMAPDERVFAVSPLGHPTAEFTRKERVLFGAGRPKHRKPLEEIAPGVASWPEWAQRAVEAAQVAPSAMNRQPWRFSYEEGALVVRAVGGRMPRISRRLDCGIAMLNAEVGARAAGQPGSWELLEHPDVARFVPGSREQAL